MSLRETISDPSIRYPADATAAIGVVGTIAGYLPTIAAILACIWYGMIIYDWIEKRWAKKKAGDPQTTGQDAAG